MCDHFILLLSCKKCGICSTIFVVPGEGLKFEDLKHCESCYSHVVHHESVYVCVIVLVTEVGEDPSSDVFVLLISLYYTHQNVSSVCEYEGVEYFVSIHIKLNENAKYCCI